MQAKWPLDSGSKAVSAVALGHCLAQSFVMWLIYFLKVETLHFDFGWGRLLGYDLWQLWQRFSCRYWWFLIASLGPSWSLAFSLCFFLELQFLRLFRKLMVQRSELRSSRISWTFQLHLMTILVRWVGIHLRFHDVINEGVDMLQALLIN